MNFGPCLFALALCLTSSYHRIVAENCPGSSTETGGTVTSPSYPGKYGWESNCQTNIIVPNGQYITFKTDEFDLEPVCSNAALTITNLEGFESSTHKFCTRTLPKSFTSKGSSELSFSSRDWAWGENPLGSSGHKGFKVTYNVAGCKADDLNLENNHGDHVNPHSVYKPGDIATFQCQDGFIYDNWEQTVSMKCESDKKWHKLDANQWPICIRKPEACPEPIILHGNYSYDKLAIGGRVNYTCDKGHSLVMNTYAVCEISGKWSSTPHCYEDCPVPTLSNGSCSYDTLAFLGRVNYTCDSGFTLFGTDTAVCLNSGKWSDKPNCYRDCPEPKLSHGNYSYNTLSFGGRVKYTCDIGHSLLGSEWVECLENGEWSDQPMCFLIECPKLNNVTNADVSSRLHDYDDVVKVTCRPCFFFDESFKTQTREVRCLETKEWSGNATQGCRFSPEVCPGGSLTTDQPATPTVSNDTTSPPKNVTSLTTSSTLNVTSEGSVLTSPKSSVTNESSTVQPIGTSTENITSEEATPTARMTTEPTTTGNESTSIPTEPVVTDNATNPSIRNQTTTPPAAGTSLAQNTSEFVPVASSSTLKFNITSAPVVVPASTVGFLPDNSSVPVNATGGGGNFDTENRSGSMQGTYVGIGVGCGLVLIILVALGLYFFRRSASNNPEHRLVNVDGESGNEAYENQLYHLDSVDESPMPPQLGANERAIDVEEPHRESKN